MQVWGCVTFSLISLSTKVSSRKNLGSIQFNNFIKKLLKLWINRSYHFNFQRYHLLNVFISLSASTLCCFMLNSYFLILKKLTSQLVIKFHMYSLHDGLTTLSFTKNRKNKQPGWKWVNIKQPA